MRSTAGSWQRRRRAAAGVNWHTGVKFGKVLPGPRPTPPSPPTPAPAPPLPHIHSLRHLPTPFAASRRVPPSCPIAPARWGGRAWPLVPSRRALAAVARCCDCGPGCSCRRRPSTRWWRRRRWWRRQRRRRNEVLPSCRAWLVLPPSYAHISHPRFAPSPSFRALISRPHFAPSFWALVSRPHFAPPFRVLVSRPRFAPLFDPRCAPAFRPLISRTSFALSFCALALRPRFAPSFRALISRPRLEPSINQLDGGSRVALGSSCVDPLWSHGLTRPASVPLCDFRQPPGAAPHAFSRLGSRLHPSPSSRLPCHPSPPLSSSHMVATAGRARRDRARGCWLRAGDLPGQERQDDRVGREPLGRPGLGPAHRPPLTPRSSHQGTARLGPVACSGSGCARFAEVLCMIIHVPVLLMSQVCQCS